MRGLLAAALVLVLGCAEAGDGEPRPAAASGIRFETAADHQVSAQRFSRALPAHKIRDLVTVTGPGGVAVTVDAWDNPEGLALAPWFERHLAFMRVPPALTAEGTAAAARVPALLVSQPRSEQSLGRDVAVFALGGRIYRITCHDRDDARSHEVYARVLATFTAEAAR